MASPRGEWGCSQIDVRMSWDEDGGSSSSARGDQHRVSLFDDEDVERRRERKREARGEPAEQVRGAHKGVQT